METLFKVNVEQVGVVAKSYVTLLLSRIQEAQSLMNQFGRDDFSIEIESVCGDSVVYDYDGVNVEYEDAGLFYTIPGFGTADACVQKVQDIVEAATAGVSIKSEDLPKLQELSEKLFKLIDLRGQNILATGLESKIEILKNKITFAMNVELEHVIVCYTYVLENGEVKDSLKIL